MYRGTMRPIDPLNRRQDANSDMIILGRESRSLSQKALADALGVVQATVSKMEASMLPVSDEMLDHLARALDYPPRFFLQGGGMLGVGVAELFHRKRQDVPKRDLTKIYAQIDIRTKHVEALLRSVDFPVNVPRIDIEEYDGQADEVARLVRASWQLSRGPIKDLTREMENRGILIIPFDFGTRRVDAISRWVPKLPPIVFVNPFIPKDRYRFSLAHELAHLIMHSVPHPDIEAQANRFAAEFLVPERSVHADFLDLDLPKLAVLKKYWRVSMAVLLKRAEDVGAITPNQTRYLWVQMAKAGYKTREPIELDVDGEVPLLLTELTDAHRQDLGFSPDDLGELLALNGDELVDLYLRRPDRNRSLYAL